MMNEKSVVDLARLNSAKQKTLLWRNNSGAALDATGRPVRYGLANESSQINAVLKSSDLIGIEERTITQDMVGQVVGVFTAVECKHSAWRYSGTAHEKAQKNFIDLVNSKGGNAYFFNGEKVDI